MGSIGILAGAAQGYSNSVQQLLFREFLQKARMTAGAHRSLVAWPDAFPLQYQSPFAKFESSSEEDNVASDIKIYQLNSNYGSDPRRLTILKNQFGEDIYAGLTGPSVVHLVSSQEQVERLERFHEEHYKRKLKAVKLQEFQVGYVKIVACLLVDSRIAENFDNVR